MKNAMSQFSEDYFNVIIIDEAHHCISDGYQKVLQHFPSAKVLGVTATPDRGDMRNLGEFFESLAYEYTLPKAIRRVIYPRSRAMTIPLQLDLSGVSIQSVILKPVTLQQPWIRICTRSRTR